MAISQSNYVDISSAVAGAAVADAPSLQHRRITSGVLTKPGGGQAAFGEIVRITYGMLDDLNSILGSSADRDLARQYFGIKTTAPASRPSSIEFVQFDQSGAPSNSLIHGSVDDLATMKTASSKSLTITSTTGTKTITVPDLSAAASAGDVATSIGSLFNGAESVTVTTDSGHLDITHSETGNHTEAILVASGEAAEILGLTADTGATTTLGGYVSAVDAYILSRATSKDFGSFSIEGCQSLDPGELARLKAYHMSYNVQHQLYIELNTMQGIPGLPVYQAFSGVPMTGFVLSQTANEYKLVIPAGLIAATNWTGRNTVNQIMYRQAGGMTADVDNDIDKSYLDSLLVNYYGQTAVNATPLSFFQKGNLQGGATDPRDMMTAAAEQWIKARIASDLIGLLVTSRLPANLDGKTRVAAMITNGAVAAALRSGAIIALKDLTQAQKDAVYALTGDPLAAMDVFNNGYWLDVRIQSVTVDGVEEKHAYYTLIYSKADFVRRVVGNHSLV